MITVPIPSSAAIRASARSASTSSCWWNEYQVHSTGCSSCSEARPRPNPIALARSRRDSAKPRPRTSITTSASAACSTCSSRRNSPDSSIMPARTWTGPRSGDDPEADERGVVAPDEASDGDVCERAGGARRNPGRRKRPALLAAAGRQSDTASATVKRATNRIVPASEPARRMRSRPSPSSPTCASRSPAAAPAAMTTGKSVPSGAVSGCTAMSWRAPGAQTSAASAMCRVSRRARHSARARRRRRHRGPAPALARCSTTRAPGCDRHRRR